MILSEQQLGLHAEKGERKGGNTGGRGWARPPATGDALQHARRHSGRDLPCGPFNQDSSNMHEGFQPKNKRVRVRFNIKSKNDVVLLQLLLRRPHNQQRKGKKHCWKTAGEGIS